MNRRTNQLGLLLGVLIGCVGLISLSACGNQKLTAASQKPIKGEVKTSETPKIVNIINFIRLLEPRDPKITEDVLFQTVVKQVELMNKYDLPGTFMLQYDALLDSRYQNLLKALPRDRFEIGGWLEVPQPLAENAGLKWRGSYPWDSRADVDFTTGYSPEERRKLVDVYMKDFKKIFGYYPKTVGCWYIDAYTLNYLYTKYGIIASCNCKDQIGTDGYTLWGGYWNQAYYPSLHNAYMPAQTQKGQIPVPVFRMLGSDPIRQYDIGIGTGRQGVVTLEPVYPFGGGDANWVNWYFREFVQGEALNYGYVQAGQENSFTWDAMSKGLELQFPLIAQLRDQKKLQIETLAASGAWFKKKYPLTPATSVTVNEDLQGSDKKTVWFNSRFYRLNLLWEKGTLRIRDIHLFDESVASPYWDKKSTAEQCVLLTLPFVDGHYWSSAMKHAGLVFNIERDGQLIAMEGGAPVIKSTIDNQLRVTWPLNTGGDSIKMTIDEKKTFITLTGPGASNLKWSLDLGTAAGVKLPFLKISAQRIDCSFESTNYAVTALQGQFSELNDGNYRISPKDNKILLDFSRKK
ncbi:MAG TPA: hypothetical protein VL053_14115 [Arachidicoccus sp.]|nr:hypothetical protein [Arachidicoccus sp.]